MKRPLRNWLASMGAIREELSSLRERRELVSAELAAIDRRMAMLEGLRDIEPSPPGTHPHVFTTADTPLTLHAAMADLKTAPERMLRAGDMAAAIERRGLYRMRDGRPFEAQQIHGRVGHYPTLFTKDGTFIKLR